MAVSLTKKATPADMVKKLSKAYGFLNNTLTSSLEAYEQYDAALSQVQDSLGATGEQMNIIDNVSRVLGDTTQFTSADVAGAFNDAAQSGWSFEKSVTAMPSVLNLAAVDGMSFATSVDCIDKYMSALQINAGETETLIDQMAKTSEISGTSVAKLGDAIIAGGNSAQRFGLGLSDTNALLGMFAQSGIEGADAGHQMEAMLSSVYDKSGKGAKALSQLGIEAVNADGSFRNITDIVGDLDSSMSTKSIDEYKQALSDVFDIEDDDTINAMMENLQKLDESKAQIEDSKGAAAEMAGENPSNDIQQSLFNIGAAFAPIIDAFNTIKDTALAPFFEALATYAGFLGTVLSYLIVPLSFLANIFTFLSPLIYSAVAAMLVYMGILKLKILLDKRKEVFDNIKAIPTMIKKMTVDKLSLGPIGLVIIAVTAVIGLLVGLVKKFDCVRLGVIKFINAIIGGINFLLEKLSHLRFIGDKFKGMHIDKLSDDAFKQKEHKDALEDLGFDPMELEKEKLEMPEPLEVAPPQNGEFNVGTVSNVENDDSMAEEDIELLRDLATSEAVNKYATLAPNIKIEFGDVKETADVDQVAKKLEQILCEQIAVSTELAY